MNRLLTILLLAAGTAYGQIANPPTTGSIGLGPTNDVTFNRVVTTSVGSTTNPAIRIGASNSGFLCTTNGDLYSIVNGSWSIISTDYSINFSRDSYFLNGITVYLDASVGGTLAVTGNVTMSGVNNTATAQTANSSSSLMTRSLSDARFYPLASFWLPAEDMQAYNSAGSGNAEWTTTASVINMVTPFGRSPRTVLAADAALTQGIYTIPTGWPAGSQVRVTTYLALFGGGATTNTFVLQTGGYWTTNTNIISPVVNSIGSVFSASSLLTTNVAGTGVTNEYFKISNTFSFATNANVENRQVFVGRSSTSTNDTATNTIYFIGSHVELLP